MIVLIDNNEDTVGPENIDNCGNTTRIVKQSERLQNRLVLSGQLVKTYFLKAFHIFGMLPLLLYSYFVQCKDDIDNDFISI